MRSHPIPAGHGSASTNVPLSCSTRCGSRCHHSQDCEYEREGTCNLFVFLEPHVGWRHVEVTKRRTKQDFAQAMQALLDVHFPDAPLIRLVLDNLNTHTPASLYEAFPPEEARRLLRRLEFHYTPKHGSWLNMAEIELSVLGRQCLDQRLPSMQRVQAVIARLPTGTQRPSGASQVALYHGGCS
jgi:hypothetical protein